ncbi:MAG: Ig-like domain-containing protein [Mollicutes bacterium]|nr:Ig-like domain-containing protein [Mollicutes bacterium]MDD7264425.1 Ig-like domain-containing protein [bacterium]MDY4979369.1 Ig-like domain-containing protein [Candidatus Onthovivens sp.]
MKRKFIPILTISALLSLGALSGTLVSCGDVNNPVDPTPSIKKVTISAGKETIKVGEETQITVKADDANVTTGFTIESSDPTVAVVLGSKVKGLKAGSAKLTATFKSVKSQELTITVEEDDSAYVSLTAAIQEASDGECKNSKGTTTNEYAVKGVVVSTDKDQNMVIYDGESYGYVYKKANTDISSFNVGDVVSVKGQLTNYYGVLQFSDPKVEKINAKIELPKAKEYSAEDFVKFGTTANKNNSEITTGIATRNEYVTAKKLKYVGGHKFEIEGVSKEEFKLISCYKAEKTLREQIGKIVNGSEVTVTGSILGFNSGNGYFNLVPTTVDVTKAAIKAEGITLNVGTGTVKTYEAIELSATLTPEGAGGNVTYSLADGDKTKAKIVGNKLYGLEVGEVTVTAKVDNLVSEAKKVTITAGDNEFATAQTKTVSDMKALTTADQKVAYKVTGVVSGAETNDKYGNITIKAEDGTDTIDSYGVSSDFTAFSKQDNGTLKFTNPKNFNTDIINKLFANGDTVEFFVVPYIYDEKSGVQFYFAFNRLVKKAEGGETPTPPTETTMDGLYKVADPEIGKTYKFGLDQKNSSVNKTLYFNGEISGNFLSSTENDAEAIDVTLEGTLDACKVSFTKGEAKTYIEAASYTNKSGGTSYKATLVTTPTLTWKYDSSLKTLVTTIDTVDVYIGTYNTFTTFSVSKTSYATSDTNYVSHFLTKLAESEKVHVTGVTADASITVDEKKTVKINASVTPDNATVKGLTYTSNNTEIATVSDDGTVTGVKAGETTITVASKEDPTKTATVKVTVNKVDTPAGLLEKTYSFAKITGTASADGKVVTFFDGDGVIGFEHSTGTNTSNAPAATTSESLRMYKGHNLIVTAKENVELQSISFTYDDYSSKKYVVDLVAKSGETTLASTFDKAGLSYIVEGLSGYKTITFSNNAQARLVSMKVSYIVK